MTLNVGQGSGTGLTADDAPFIEAQVRKIVDARMQQKMQGQGGYAWRIHNNGV
jgi:hypothetical protein